MLSVKSSFNLPAIVLGIGLVCVLGMNVATAQRNARALHIAELKKANITRLLVDR